MPKDEAVLCVERAAVEGVFSLPQKGFLFDPTCYRKLFDIPWDRFSWISREKCENDPSQQQIIPYMVVTHREYHGGPVTVFTYWRNKQAGEQRLHGMRSIGIGGHINHGDYMPGGPDLAFKRGLRRELKEELDIDVLDGHVIGLLKDDTTPVGSVHLGVVMLVRSGPSYRLPTSATCDMDACANVGEHRLFLEEPKEEFEPWSQLLLGTNEVWDRYSGFSRGERL
jgi:predicted NUDIX family phosphoesterase